MKRERPLAWCCLLGGLALGSMGGSSGCYRYTYMRRSPDPPHAKIAVDEHRPASHTGWSYFWGLTEHEWSPDPKECDGLGAGRVRVSYEWYSPLMGLISLGTAVPATLTLYCTTEPPAGDPRSGP
jgi:hypothetical protein